MYSHIFTYLYVYIHSHVQINISVQPIEFEVSSELNLPSQSHGSFFQWIQAKENLRTRSTMEIWNWRNDTPSAIDYIYMYIYMPMCTGPLQITAMARLSHIYSIWYICIYIFIYIYIYIYIYTITRTNIYAYTYALIYTYTHRLAANNSDGIHLKHILKHIYIYMFIYIPLSTGSLQITAMDRTSYMFTYIYICTYTYLYTRARCRLQRWTEPHKYIHTYKYVLIYICAHKPAADDSDGLHLINIFIHIHMYLHIPVHTDSLQITAMDCIWHMNSYIYRPHFTYKFIHIHMYLHIPLHTGSLQITAMDRTSLADTSETSQWNECITLSDMHPYAVHVADAAMPSTLEMTPQGLPLISQHTRE